MENRSTSHGQNAHHGVVSLLTLLGLHARAYLALGERIQEARNIYFESNLLRERHLEDEDKKSLVAVLGKMAELCDLMELETESELIRERSSTGDLPSGEAFDLIVSLISKRLDKKSLYYIPAHRAGLYDVEFCPSTVATRFPSVAPELNSAADCYALGEFTASVFHATRAIEVGVRELGRMLNVKFPDKSIDLADMQNILDQVESKIRAIREGPTNSKDLKEEQINLLSEAAVQFRYFKDAWRVRSAHGRATYDETQSKRILDHTRDYFVIISPVLIEQA